MKNSQKLIVDIEGIKSIVKFEEIDKKLYPLVKKLEVEGDLYGPVVDVFVNNSGMELCITLSYHDKKRGSVKPTIFGFDNDDFLLKQYK